MDEQALKECVTNGWSTRRMAAHFKCSQTNIRYWLKRFGLQSQPQLAQRRCSQCGEADPARFYGHKKDICGKCHNSYTIAKGRELKQKARSYLGNQCTACGFRKYQVSLDIHHLDPALKDPHFVSMRGWSWNKVEAELQNCVLLCKNCHAALHAGLINLESHISDGV